jgi:isoquinoline 1-oxidoreductase alpha subunit
MKPHATESKPKKLGITQQLPAIDESLLYYPIMFIRGHAMQLNINGQSHNSSADASMPLLWVLRDELNLTGTKYGCGVAACGACTVHVDGQAVRSCVVPASAVVGQKITTIESLGSAEQLHPLQAAWIAEQVPQCGYCQSGMLMAAADLLARKPHPSDAEIDAAMTNLCRCGTYQRVRAAIHRAANSIQHTAMKQGGAA